MIPKNLINLGILPPLQTDHDPRFSYIITPWEENPLSDQEVEDENGNRQRYYYICHCSGFWEKKFVASVPCVVADTDLEKGDVVTLLRQLYENLVNSCYDLVLMKLGYEPYGPSPLHLC